MSGDRLAAWLGWVTVAIALLGFAGWVLASETLSSILPGRVAMNPMTALGLMLAGCSLVLVRGSPRQRWLFLATATSSAAIGSLRLGEYLSFWQLGVDFWLFGDRVRASGRGVMALLTALDLVCVSCALIALLHPRGWRRSAAQTLLLIAGLFAFAALLGHFYGVQALHGPMAINTAMSFVLLVAGGLALEPDFGIVRAFRGPGSGARLARRLTPWLVVLFITLGWLRLRGFRAGLYTPEVGSTIFDLARLTVLVGVVWIAARSVERADTLRFQAELALRRHAAELEAANVELDAFCYSVSHDLRAPLRSIDGFSRAILEDSADRLDAAGRDRFERMCAAAGKMAALIDALLQLSQVSRKEIQRETVDLSALATEVLAELRQREPARMVEAVVMPDLVVEGDRRLLTLVLENLLGNAWKYTRTRPTAHLEIGRRDDGSEPCFFVRDDGVGFDMSFADKLFVPFQRLHPEREFEGTGIGLATVRRIVQRHGGKVWAEARPGVGATFFFSFGMTRGPGVGVPAKAVPRASMARTRSPRWKNR